MPDASQSLDVRSPATPPIGGRTKWQQWHAVVLLFALTRGAYLWDLATSSPTEQHFLPLDSQRYWEAATSIAKGSTLLGSQPFSFAPLYAYYLGAIQLVGGNIWAVYLSQVGLSALTVWLVYKLGLATFGHHTATIAALLWCLYGAAGVLELTVVETTLGTFLTLLGVYLMLPSRGRNLRWPLLGGLALGLACLARPNTLLLAPFAGLWLLTRGTWRARQIGKRSGPVIILLAGIGVGIAPATFRNRAVSGEWVLISAQGGVTFAQGNNPNSEGAYAQLAGLSGDPITQADEATKVAQKALGRRATTQEVDAYWYQQGLSYLRANLGDAAILWAKKLRGWFGSDEISMEYVLSAERSIHPSLWLMPLPFGALLGFAMLGMRRRFLFGKSALLGCIVLTNLVSVLIFFFSSRYRVPAVPVLCIMSAHGLRAAITRSASPLRWALGGVATSLSLVSWSPAYRLQEASFFYLLGNQYFRDGEHHASLPFYERAASGRPGDWKIHHNLGEAYGATGHYRKAVETLERAQQLDPTQPSTARALSYYRSMLESEPR
ncbi:MAG: glycosyltransferase family 39 protein [Polyangiaceae bacterium]|nr:glycosyltransferase family 39 protein [Polyangiaceae bacterium]